MPSSKVGAIAGAMRSFLDGSIFRVLCPSRDALSEAKNDFSRLEFGLKQEPLYQAQVFISHLHPCCVPLHTQNVDEISLKHRHMGAASSIVKTNIKKPSTTFKNTVKQGPGAPISSRALLNMISKGFFNAVFYIGIRCFENVFVNVFQWVFNGFPLEP